MNMPISKMAYTSYLILFHSLWKWGHAFQLQRSCRKVYDEIPYLKYVANDKYAKIDDI